MIIWLMVVAVLVVLGVTSYYQGAVRALVSLVGLLLALFLSLPLAPMLRPLVPKVGLASPAWAFLVPPAVVFALFVLIFTGAAFFVHHKVALYFKYKTDDYTRLRWERLNQRLGLCVGLVAAGIYSILLGLLVYIFGYAAVQVAGDDSPATLRLLGKARQELKDSGLDRTLAAIDPMPENYYIATDVVGLVYHNNVLQERLANYPAFLTLGERSEFQDIATDVELQGLLQTKAPFLSIVNHPKIKAIINNAEIIQALQQIDLKDLASYLKTGKSGKYEDEKILGRWKLDPSASLTLAKKKNPDMPAKEMAAIKLALTVFLSNVSFLATPDNKAMVKVELSEDAQKMVAALEAAAAPKPTPEEAAAPQMDPSMARRYGLRPGGLARPTAPTPAAPVPAAKNLVKVPSLPKEGTWQREGDRYKLKMQDDKGTEHNVDAVAEEEKLLITADGRSLVFVR